MPGFRILSALIGLAVFASIGAFAQQNSPAKPQTPRQALIDIVTNGAEGAIRHLTTEVQEALAKADKKSSLGILAGFSSARPGKGLQSFETGPILFAYTDDRQNTRYEVNVDNDDLNGDQDELQLSIHAFRDGQEQQQDFGLMSSRLIVALKQQQGIWRLSNISVRVDLPIGSPEFVKKTLLNTPNGHTSVGLIAGAAGNGGSKESDRVQISLSPWQVVTYLAFSESQFAREHPETGFTCSLVALAETAAAIGVDRQIASGSLDGYRFNLSGCEGKPAGSFQVTAEPIAAGAGKAYCTDATQNLRVSEDGRGASCLSFGTVPKGVSSDRDLAVWDVSVPVGNTSKQ